MGESKGQRPEVDIISGTDWAGLANHVMDYIVIMRGDFDCQNDHLLEININYTRI